MSPLKSKQWAVALVSGLLFGTGLVVSGMTDPRKVIGFLDIGGAWDPSLAFVMLGAVTVHSLAYRWVRRRQAPLFAGEFALPKQRRIDTKLIGGAALFGIGWGLAGYCPGPGIVSLGAGSRDALLFVATMLLGMLLTAKYDSWRARTGERAASARDAAAAR